ncbi:dual specificity protein phosphatase 14-like [Ischnura elegans]|uniref:dual specificity protein phosphatase 14-like n=1 Tax=Ischnura elegans TaxID=197161 RepID=UPI001ED86943|nr:dual specificity protein phosphatase 14-like [Ischnura elegans]
MKVPQSVSSAMGPQLTQPAMVVDAGDESAVMPGAVTDVQGQDSLGSPRSLYAAARGVAEVSSCLLLGEARGVEAGLLAALGVTCVVTAAAELPPLPLGPPVEDSVRLALRDSPGDCIESLFDAVADKVDAVRAKGGRTLVHCVAGVSRSAALCLAYLMKYEGMTLRKAFVHLRSRRPAVRPNTGFFRQLIAYERRLFGRSTVDMVKIPTGDNGHFIPDVYEPDYRRTLLFEQRYGRQLMNGRRC